MCKKLKGFGMDKKYRTEKDISKQVLSGVLGVQTEKGSGDGSSLARSFKPFLFRPFSHGRLQFILMGRPTRRRDVLLVVPPSERPTRRTDGGRTSAF